MSTIDAEEDICTEIVEARAQKQINTYLMLALR
jgi:hypothetical protein